MTLAPFVFKKYRSPLNVETIKRNLNTNAVVTRSVPGGDVIMKRQAFDITFQENELMLIKSTTGEKRGIIGLIPIATGTLTPESDGATCSISLRPSYKDIAVLLVLFTVQAFCAYYSIVNAYYLIAAFSILFILLAYILVVAKFGAECRNYLTMIQKSI